MANSEQLAGEPKGFAYTLLLSGSGDWIGPKVNGEPDLTVFDTIEAARPLFARITTHSGTEGDPDAVPVPPSQEITDRLVALREMGIHLGVSLNAYWVHGSKRQKAKSVAEVLDEACRYAPQREISTTGSSSTSRSAVQAQS